MKGFVTFVYICLHFILCFTHVHIYRARVPIKGKKFITAAPHTNRTHLLFAYTQRLRERAKKDGLYIVEVRGGKLEKIKVRLDDVNA